MEAVSQETNNFVEGGLITTDIFVYIFEVCKFLCGGIIDQAWCIHEIDILESLLKGAPNFFWGFTLNDRLVLVRDKFEKDTYNFAYCQIIFFFILHYAIDQDL